MKLEFSRQIFEKYSISNFLKIRPVQAKLFHADGQHEEVKNLFSQLWVHANYNVLEHYYYEGWLISKVSNCIK